MNRTDLEMAQDIINTMSMPKDARAKHVKKDKGLIEKVEISRMVLTEDNKMLLND